MALHSLQLLKAIVNIPGDAVDIDDEASLPSPYDTMTAWEYWLSVAQSVADSQIEKWHGDAMPDPAPAGFLQAEVLLVQSEITKHHGVVRNLSPEEIQTGTIGDGTKVRWSRVSETERGVIITTLRNRARSFVTGEPENLVGPVIE